MRKTVLATVVVSGVLLAATASLAASDYYLKFEGGDGESRARSQMIELQSWSFVGTPASAEEQTVTFAVPEPGDASTAVLARMCASGKHVKNAMLNSPNGRYRLEDVVISSCAVKGNERQYEFRGHVTLMK